MLRTLLVAAVVALYILVVAPPMILHAWLSRSGERLYWAGIAGVRLALWLAGARLDVVGQEKILRNRPCIFMPNHMSNADPPAMGAILPRVSILAKKQIFRIPLLGSAMRNAEMVPVDRADRDRARVAVDVAVEILRRGLSFLVFPEGTRSRDGRLLPFKKGAFIMAIKSGVPIVPITILDSDRIMRKGEWAIHPDTIHIVIHDAIETAGYSLEQRDELMARVRAKIESALPADKRRAEQPVNAGDTAEL